MKYILKIFVIIICSVLVYSQNIEQNNNESTLIYEQRDTYQAYPPEEQNFINKEYFLGDFGGKRKKIEELGFNPQITLITDLFRNLYGGITNTLQYSALLDIITDVNLETLLGLDDTFIKAQILLSNCSSPNQICNSWQGISNIEYEPFWKIYQLYVEKSFISERLSFLFGIFDLNSEFDVRESSTIFMNPSHGIGDDFAKSGHNGPSIFPHTALAIRIKFLFNESNSLKFALLDGVPENTKNSNGLEINLNKNDGLLFATEYSYLDLQEDILNFKISLGGWFYSVESLSLTSLESHNDSFLDRRSFGFYSSIEKLLLNFSDKTNKNIMSFIRIGIANNKTNPVNYYFGSGIVFNGIISNRENDVFGVAVAHTHLTEFYKNKMLETENIEIPTYETNLEFTYSLQLTPYFSFQPNIQIIKNPIYSNKKIISVLGIRVNILF